MKNTKSLKIFLVSAFSLVIIITLVVNFSSRNSTSQSSYTPDTSTTSKTSTTKTVTKTPPPEPTIPSYTLAQVATHSNASSCWTIVGANVYDLTTWINQHPGGRDAILSLCGKDGTAAFMAQHGGQTRPENELNSLQIGIYKK